jgi:hypothetical protein
MRTPIGDNALEATPQAQQNAHIHSRPGSVRETNTGLPFFTHRGGAALACTEAQEQLATLLNHTRDEGHSTSPRNALDAASNISAATIESYLREAIEYSLTSSIARGWKSSNAAV